MRDRIVPVKNIVTLSQSANALTERPAGLPGIGVVHGPSGRGKTKAIEWLSNRKEAILVRARDDWSRGGMVRSIMEYMGMHPLQSTSSNIDLVIQELRRRPRLLIVDEGDYVVAKSALRNTLRDIHDFTMAPLLLVGMEGFQKKLSMHEMFASRVSHWVAFGPGDFGDAKLLAEQLCEIQIGDDLVKVLCDRADGSLRRIVVGLNQIETYGKAAGLKTVTMKEWGKRPLAFATGNAPALEYAPKPAGEVVALRPADAPAVATASTEAR